MKEWTTLEDRLAARRDQALMRWMIGPVDGRSSRTRTPRLTTTGTGARRWALHQAEERGEGPHRRGRTPWAHPRTATAALLVAVILVVLWLMA